MYNYSPFHFRCIFALSTNVDEPRIVKKAIEMGNKESWRLAMDVEINALRKSETWDLVLFLDG